MDADEVTAEDSSEIDFDGTADGGHFLCSEGGGGYQKAKEI